MAWALLSASPHLHRAFLVTGRYEACRKVPVPGSRSWVPGERKSARGNMVHTSKPREVDRAKAAERPEPQWCVGRMDRSGVGPSTGQRPPGAEGDPTALVSPVGGTRYAPWVVGHTAATGRKAGQCPGGTGSGSKRRPCGNRRDRTIKRDGDSQPERVLTSHRSSREKRKKGDGKHGPHGRVTSDTERPGLGADRLVPGQLEKGGAESPKPALSALPSGQGATLEPGAEPDQTAPTQLCQYGRVGPADHPGQPRQAHARDGRGTGDHARRAGEVGR